MGVTLTKRKNKDGTTSLRLVIWHNGKRWIETLKMLQLAKPTTLLDRESNKDKLRQAEAIAVARAAQLEAEGYNVITEVAKRTDAIEWMQKYVDNYTLKDKRNMQGALNRFKKFLNEEKKKSLTFLQITPVMLEDFQEFLENTSYGEGASSYYNRLKKMLKAAYRAGLMRKNVLDGVQRKIRGKAEKKETLTIEEIRTLLATPIRSDTVKNAAIFSLMTGLRWVDIKSLKWKDVRLKEGVILVTQAKTGEQVRIPLNAAALKAIGEQGKPNDNVFNLGSANGANKTLKAWIKRAGIEKDIKGWHNLRHSFGTNLIFNDVDVYTASKLLGHTSLKHTARYVTAAEELKINATNKLNIEL